MPVPSAVMMVRISSFASILSRRAFSTLRILPRSGRMAWKLPVAALLGRAAGRVALDEVELALRRVVAPSSRPACPGREPPSRTLLRRASSRALRAASRARAAETAFSTILRADRRVLLEEVAQALADDALDDALDLAVAELGLGLALELRLAELDGDDGRQALADVVAGEGLLQRSWSGPCARRSR